jgi:hypothetical protein
VTSCNCSLCFRLGALWAYFKSDEVTVEGETRAYAHGERTLAVHRCAECGCVSHWSSLEAGSDRVAVNARLLPRPFVERLPVRRFDGADTFAYLD